MACMLDQPAVSRGSRPMTERTLDGAPVGRFAAHRAAETQALMGRQLASGSQTQLTGLLRAGGLTGPNSVDGPPSPLTGLTPLTGPQPCQLAALPRLTGTALGLYGLYTRLVAHLVE